MPVVACAGELLRLLTAPRAMRAPALGRCGPMVATRFGAVEVPTSAMVGGAPGGLETLGRDAPVPPTTTAPFLLMVDGFTLGLLSTAVLARRWLWLPAALNALRGLGAAPTASLGA